jgi:hypothetical protein
MNSDESTRTGSGVWRPVGVGAHATFRCFMCSKSVSIMSGNSVQRRVPGLSRPTKVCLACDEKLNSRKTA